MKVRTFITTSLCLLSGWLGLAYFHKVDMDSYAVRGEQAPKISNSSSTPNSAEEPTAKLPKGKKLGILVAE